MRRLKQKRPGDCPTFRGRRGDAPGHEAGKEGAGGRRRVAELINQHRAIQIVAKPELSPGVNYSLGRVDSPNALEEILRMLRRNNRRRD